MLFSYLKWRVCKILDIYLFLFSPRIAINRDKYHYESILVIVINFEIFYYSRQLLVLKFNNHIITIVSSLTNNREEKSNDTYSLHSDVHLYI